MNQTPENSASTPALFSNFVMGLASATLIELGLIEDPATHSKRKSVENARQHIELLAMLKDKTRGNLSLDEGKILDKVLTDLKFEFTKVVSSK